MAAVVQGWINSLVVTVLLACAGVGALCQQPQSGPPGSLAGRLTDLYSKPLDGATVVLRNQSTGVEARSTTAKNGAFRFSGLDPGEYTLAAESRELGRGQVQDIVVAAGNEARVSTAIQFEPLPSPPIPMAFWLGEHLGLQPSSPQPDVIAWAAELLRILPLNGRRLAEIDGLIPATVSPQPDAVLAAEPMRRLTLVARDVEMPAATTSLASVQPPSNSSLKNGSSVTPVETGQLPPRPASREQASLRPGEIQSRVGPSAPLEAATMQPQGSAESTPKAALAAPLMPSPPLAAIPSPAIAETVAHALRAAVGLAFPHRERILAASRDAGPLASAVTTTITATDLQALPASGRRWQEFIFDNAPTSSAPAGIEPSSLRGSGTQSAEIAVDGAPRGLAFGGSSGTSSSASGAEIAGMAHVWAGGRGFAVSESAIREVRTVAGNVEAQGARAAGGRVNLETRRGANGLHGQGFLFDRQNVWGAQNPFTQWVRESAAATSTTTPAFTSQPFTPPDHELTWGVGVGSHIRRDKLFWFGALDGYQRNDPAVSTVKHPDQFFAQPSNDQMQVLAARLGKTSTSQGLAAYSSLLETLGSLLGPAPRTATQWTGFARLDWEAAERHRFTLEGIGALWNAPGGGLTRVSETYGNHSLGSSQANQQWLLGRWEAFLTSNLLAVTQASVGRTMQGARPESPSAWEQTLNRNVWNQLPQIAVDSRYGFTIGNPSRFGPGSYPDEHLYQAQEALNWVHGGLLVKAGFDAAHNADATTLLPNHTGTYSYASPENFASDALVFAAFGLSDALDPFSQHNCDATGKVWRDTTGAVRGLGALPCYSYYSQTIGPSDWHLSTNDWAAYTTAQWQPHKLLVVSAGLRWEREVLPPPIQALLNPKLPLTQTMPSLGNNWGPRLSLAWGGSEGHWPVLRMGYGIYFGRTRNDTIETALTQTGSLKGDLNFFLRPTDNLNAGGAPPFPYVMAGQPQSAVKPGAVEFAPGFRNPQVHQALVAFEETLPAHFSLTASAMVSLARFLPISIDTNFDPDVNPRTITYGVVDSTGKGPIKAGEITVPFYASWPSSLSPTGFAGRLHSDYQQISGIFSRANSTYEAAMLRISRYGRRGLTFHAHYTYSHAMDWNPNESARTAGNDVLDPADFGLEYGTSNLDVRHTAALTVVWESPWKLRNLAGELGNGWRISGIGHFRSGLPFTMRTAGSLAKEFPLATGAAIVGLGPGMNGSGGDNRVYGVGSDSIVYNIGRNTYRYPATWKADLRLGKRFDLGQMRQLELLAESFNLFNHQNVTEIETVGYSIEPGSLAGALPTLNFLTGVKANTTAFGQPLNINATDFYRERQIQLGLRLRF